MLARISLAISAAALTALLAGQAAAKSQKEFLTDAIEGNTAEILMGQLALDKGASQGVKTFAQTLIDDHTKAKAQSVSVAQGLGVTPPPGPPPAAEAEMKRLQQLTGEAFDREFVRFMVADHQKDIGEYRQEASAGSGPSKELAAQSLPTLEKHLQMARALEGQK